MTIYNQRKFEDKDGNLITIGVDDNYYIRAYTEDGQEIGEFDYHFVEGFENIPDYYELWGMDILEKYQGRGIGTEMIRLGEDIFNNVTYPDPYETNINNNHLSSEGLGLLDSCYRKGIIKNFYSNDGFDD